MITIKRPLLAVIILAGIFGGILISNAAGFWKTQSTKTPAKIKTGEFAGMADPADIRGSYTFLDIEKAFAIDAATLCTAFSTADILVKPEDKVNTLETLYTGKTGTKEIGTDSVRLFVALAKGIPYNPGEGTGLPPNAVRYLMQNKLITADQANLYRVTELEGSVPAQSTPATSEQAAAPKTTQSTSGTAAQSTTEHTSLPKTVTGSTTFADVLSWGLTEKEIEAIIGFPIPQKTTVIKDAVTSQGKSFGTIKTALQELINKKNQ